MDSQSQNRKLGKSHNACISALFLVLLKIIDDPNLKSSVFFQAQGKF